MTQKPEGYRTNKDHWSEHTEASGTGISGSVALSHRNTNLPPPKNLGANAPEPVETATYILDMSLALRNIANDSGHTFLAYLLDMAAEEADRQKNSA